MEFFKSINMAYSSIFVFDHYIVNSSIVNDL